MFTSSSLGPRGRLPCTSLRQRSVIVSSRCSYPDLLPGSRFCKLGENKGFRIGRTNDFCIGRAAIVVGVLRRLLTVSVLSLCFECGGFCDGLTIRCKTFEPGYWRRPVSRTAAI